MSGGEAKVRARVILHGIVVRVREGGGTGGMGRGYWWDGEGLWGGGRGGERKGVGCKGGMKEKCT